MAYRVRDEVFVECPICQTETVRVTIDPNNIGFPEQEQVKAAMLELGWEVRQRGFRIDCICPECSGLIDEDGQQESEQDD